MSQRPTPRPLKGGRPSGASVHWTVALGVALLGACVTESTMPAQTPDDIRDRYTEIPSSAVDLEAQPLTTGSSPASQIEDSRRVVLKTAAEWERYWALFYGNVSPTPPTPVIAFESEMVVIATSGMRASGGYTIQIEGVFESEGEVLVAVLETSPGALCMSTQALTAPATAVRVSASDSPVRFVERSEETPCT